MNRLTKSGLVTTVFGVGVFVYCGVMMYTEKASSIELAGFFGLGLMLLRSKDSLIGLGPAEK
jgi:hypothetical protein